MLSVGSEVEGYRIEGILGYGGMGVVYEATETDLKRKVALKILPAHLSGDPAFRERFRREGEIQAALDHQHIIPVYAAGETESGLFIAMRLVRGPTLKDLLEAGSLDASRTVSVLAQIADALDTAHAAGLIHRDVKPQNVLVAEHDHAYLADFGLTKGAGHSGLTRTNEFLGSISYVAPEQVRGEDATSASDIYAFGAMLYECLTGKVPFPKPSEAAVLFAHVNEPPPAVSTHRPDLPAALDGVVARAMAKEPADRFASASALIDAAREAFGGVPVGEAPPPRAPAPSDPDEPGAGPLPRTRTSAPRQAERPRGPVRRSRALAILGVAALIAAALGVVAGTRSSSSGSAVATTTTANRDLTVRHPETWQVSTAAPSRLAVASPTAIDLQAPGASDAGFTAGVTREVGPDLIPRALRARIAGPLPSRERVRIGEYEGYRYAGVRLDGDRRRLTLFTIPTTEGVAALTCFGPVASRPALAACERIVDTVTLRRARTDRLGPDRAFAAALATTMTGVNRARATQRRAMRAARKRTTLARGADATSAGYAAAARRLRTVRVVPDAVPARAALVTALQDAATGYGRLGDAARRGSSGAFRNASRDVRRAEARLRAALLDLERLGYRVAASA